jgi:hypothetical protein
VNICASWTHAQCYVCLHISFTLGGALYACVCILDTGRVQWVCLCGSSTYVHTHAQCVCTYMLLPHRQTYCTLPGFRMHTHAQLCLTCPHFSLTLGPPYSVQPGSNPRVVCKSLIPSPRWSCLRGSRLSAKAMEEGH